MSWRRRWTGLLVLAAVALAPVAARAQFFSPGPLSKVHGNLEGLDNCFKCHEAGEEVGPNRCMSCHTEVKSRIDNGKGFHGRLAPNKRACGPCHTEHLGESRTPIQWGGGGKKGFDHDATGWPLRGKHKSVGCDECHEKRLVDDPGVLELMRKTRRETYLGLSSECSSCHFDEHRGQTGPRCTDCHDESHFKPPAEFDHGSDTEYPLTGRHQKVPCGDCHPSEKDTLAPANAFPKPKSRSFMRFQPIPHEGCLDCHEDPHKGAFGSRCANCHSTAGWKQMNPNAKDTGFHDKHRFQLRGGHVGVPCKSCHGPWPGKEATFRGLAFAACTDCHFDGHEGQLEAKGGKLLPCEGCHDVGGFLPPAYEAEDHDKTRYKLTGGHKAAPCNGCHPANPALARAIPQAMLRDLQQRERPQTVSFAQLELPGKGDRCEDCHADVHEGQFARRKPPIACDGCHVAESWITANKFDHDKQSRFPLEGKHEQVLCGACHVADAKGNVVYRPLDMRCAACHFDVHLGQFAAPASASAPLKWEDTDCKRCHNERGFKSVKFDHNDPKQSRYPLKGKHAEVACAGCHTPVTVQEGLQVVVYKPMPMTCASCHEDYHKGALAGVKQP